MPFFDVGGAFVLGQIDGEIIDRDELEAICRRLPDPYLLNVGASVVRSLRLLDSMLPDPTLIAKSDELANLVRNARGWL